MRDDFAFTRLMRMCMEGNGWTQQQFICAAGMELRGLRRTVQKITPWICFNQLFFLGGNGCS